MKQILATSLLVPVLLISAAGQPIMAEDYVPEDGTSFNSKGDHGNLDNFLLGERALKAGQTEKAIVYLKQSVNSKDNDMDARVAYATALEQKYRHQVDKDPELFRECISQWLYALRAVAPEEEGVSVLKFLYKDEERDMPAKVHIKDLTGRLPKPFESNEKFLARVCAGKTSVSGSVLNRKRKESDSSSQNGKD